MGWQQKKATGLPLFAAFRCCVSGSGGNPPLQTIVYPLLWKNKKLARIVQGGFNFTFTLLISESVYLHNWLQKVIGLILMKLSLVTPR